MLSPYALTAASVIALFAFLLRKMSYDFGVIVGRGTVMLLFYALFVMVLIAYLLRQKLQDKKEISPQELLEELYPEDNSD